MLKSPIGRTDFCSLETLSIRLFMKLLLKSPISIECCFVIQPTIIFDFLGLIISIKVDSSLFLLYIFKSCHGL